MCVSLSVASCRPSEQCMQSVTCRSRSIRQWEGKVVLRQTHSQMTIFHPSWPSAWRNLLSCPFPHSVTREHVDTIHRRSATRTQGAGVKKSVGTQMDFNKGVGGEGDMNVHVFLAVPSSVSQLRTLPRVKAQQSQLIVCRGVRPVTDVG